MTTASLKVPGRFAVRVKKLLCHFQNYFLLSGNDDCGTTIHLINVVHRLKNEVKHKQSVVITKQYKSCAVSDCSGLGHNRHLWIIIFLNGFWCSFSTSSAKLHTFHKFFLILIPSLQRTEASCSVDKANWKLQTSLKKRQISAVKDLYWPLSHYASIPKNHVKHKMFKNI